MGRIYVFVITSDDSTSESPELRKAEEYVGDSDL